jgi:tetratricopeptide (TPR) repeat protein
MIPSTPFQPGKRSSWLRKLLFAFGRRFVFLAVGYCVLVIWSPGTASAAESFTNRLTAMQSRIQSDPTNTLILFQLGDLCHDEGARNNAKAVILAQTYLTRLLAIDPNHAMARVMFGSVLTMRARDTFWPITRLNYVKAGNREMDAAVQLAPKDAQVRFARAVNNFHMPDIMGRQETVQADLAWLWQQAQLTDTKLNVDQKQTIALFQGQTLQKNNQLDEARQIWRAGLALAPESQDAVRLKEQLKALKAPRK